MWEYKRQEIKFKTISELINELNKEGEDDWEIIYYEEHISEKYDNKNTVKILYKRKKYQHD